MPNIPVDWSLVIGGISLPVFAEAVLWLLHRVGVPTTYDQVAAYAISAAFAVVVITANFYPQYAAAIVGAVTFLYTLISTLQKVLPNLKTAIVQSLTAPHA